MHGGLGARHAQTGRGLWGPGHSGSVHMAHYCTHLFSSVCILVHAYIQTRTHASSCVHTWVHACAQTQTHKYSVLLYAHRCTCLHTDMDTTYVLLGPHVATYLHTSIFTVHTPAHTPALLDMHTCPGDMLMHGVGRKGSLEQPLPWAWSTRGVQGEVSHHAAGTGWGAASRLEGSRVQAATDPRVWGARVTMTVGSLEPRLDIAHSGPTPHGSHSPHSSLRSETRSTCGCEVRK